MNLYGKSTSMDDQFLNKIYQHIEDNLDNEHYSVADMARHAGLSQWSVYIENLQSLPANRPHI